MNPEIEDESTQEQIQILLYDLGIVVDTKTQLQSLIEVNDISILKESLLKIIDSLDIEESLMMRRIDKLN